MLGEYPYFVPSFGYHGFPSFVRAICFGSWGFPDSRVGTWLGWSRLVWLHMGLLQLGLGLGPGLGTKFPFQFQVCSHLLDEPGVTMELCASGIALNYLGCPVYSKCVNILHGLHFHFPHLPSPKVVDT